MNAPNIAEALAQVREEPEPAPIEALVDPVSLMTPAQRKRMQMAAVYAGKDLHHLHDEGTITMRPKGPRVLMFALLQEDAHGMTALMDYDARKAIAHVIVGVGTGVERHLDKLGWPDDARDTRTLRQRLRCWWQGRGVEYGARPRLGDHFYILSTAADRASKTDKACRYWYAHVDDLSGAWEVPSDQAAVPDAPAPPR